MIFGDPEWIFENPEWICQAILGVHRDSRVSDTETNTYNT